MFKSINGGKLPTRGSKYSAGVDVYANEDVTIGAGDTAIIGLGIALDKKYFNKIVSERYHYLEENLDKTFQQELDEFLSAHYVSLKPRSSLRAKGLISHSAVIDLDYQDEIKMIIYNSNKTPYKVNKNDRIGQLLLMEHKSYLFGIESDEERTGGLGSTGK